MTERGTSVISHGPLRLRPRLRSLTAVALPLPPERWICGFAGNQIRIAPRRTLLPIHPPQSGARHHGPSSLNRPLHHARFLQRDGQLCSRPSSNKRPPETPSAINRGRWPLHEVIQIHMLRFIKQALSAALPLFQISLSQASRLVLFRTWRSQACQDGHPLAPSCCFLLGLHHSLGIL